MRVLLVVYEFPPSRSPRALRWRYLVRELALQGHEVHVLLPDLGDSGVDFPQSPGKVVLHPVFPGPVGWLVGRSRRRQQKPQHDQAGPAAPAAGAGASLNWRGRLVEVVKQLAGLLLFPDVRAEWSPWARRALRRLLAEVRPDVVVTSHEPATTLPLGLLAKQLGYPWVADLGDPVCAPYTPPRWHRRAWQLEARVCAGADLVIVTTEATRQLLIERHGQDPARCSVLPNGYDDRRPPSVATGDEADFDDDRLELIYAGRLYGYRDPTPLLEAVSRSPGVRLTLVVPDPPTGGAAAIAAAAADRVRIFGPMPHASVMRMQERADVLVNVGNRGLPAQIPAKLYEYLGLARPVLHLYTGEGDVAGELLRQLGRGWLCEDDARALASLLADLREHKRAGRLGQELMLDPLPDYAHSALGRRLAALLNNVIGRAAAAD